MGFAEKESFLRSIITTMRDNPEWTSSAFDAVAIGAAEAQDTMQRRIEILGHALLASMSFISAGRMPADMKTRMADMVLKAYEVVRLPALSHAERKALNKVLAQCEEDNHEV